MVAKHVVTIFCTQMFDKHFRPTFSTNNFEWTCVVFHVFGAPVYFICSSRGGTLGFELYSKNLRILFQNVPAMICSCIRIVARTSCANLESLGDVRPLIQDTPTVWGAIVRSHPIREIEKYQKTKPHVRNDFFADVLWGHGLGHVG